MKSQRTLFGDVDAFAGSLLGHLVNHSRSPAIEGGLKTAADNSHSELSSWWSTYSRNGLSGKTSPVFCHLTPDGTLEPSSQRWQNSGMGGPTESWTLSTSEFRSDVVESSLSDILETGDVPQRFFLSPTACTGILRRAAKRNRKLPEQLRLALVAVAEQE